MADFLDIALIFDPVTRRADLALGEDGDLVLDDTPATPMLISIGSDRRARSDDTLPSGIGDLNAPTSFVERRGWSGDALDAQGRRIGSRLWLLDRAKASELTRRLAEIWAAEALEWMKAETGTAAEVVATWVRKEVLSLVASYNGMRVEILRRFG
ncbi:phage GP46 family protein [Microvirga terricola]|uniref:Mu-like prophage protein gp46 n=1 Tax=Microvirga terricola TaxID=2719797 RepID=A0ABX0V8K0_9HYPH|nr:phage GP46 family protein [Microvirga terricola]NIX75380.1 hypothetical protein [Microvirga terricola]